MKQLLNAVFAICCAALPCRAGENPPEAEYARLGKAAAAEMLTVSTVWKSRSFNALTMIISTI